MKDGITASSTFQRSCRHWSATSADEMAAFYRLATYDYTLLAQQIDWAGELERLSKSASGETLSLLDVACGSGKFPAALLASEPFESYGGKTVDYDLLDPSEFSLREAAAQLRHPFRAGRAFHCTLQDLSASNHYDIVWATHALYCVPADELPLAAERFCAAIRRGGVGFIAHATDDSHYLRFQRLYLDHWPDASGVPFSTASEVAEAVQAAGRRSFGAEWSWYETTIDYEGTLALGDEQTVQRYLQRCLFDDTITLGAMRANEHLGEYLRCRQDHAQGVWRFPQRAKLMRFGAVVRQTLSQPG